MLVRTAEGSKGAEQVGLPGDWSLDAIGRHGVTRGMGLLDILVVEVGPGVRLVGGHGEKRFPSSRQCRAIGWRDLRVLAVRGSECQSKVRTNSREEHNRGTTESQVRRECLRKDRERHQTPG